MFSQEEFNVGISTKKLTKTLPFHLSILKPSPLPFLSSHTEIFSSILDNLKAYEPYAHPFLVKVSKREVPNYYDIIKRPMDLGTMTKNLKKYDLQAFKSDLNLIWDNCFLFNGPSIYTDYAKKMKAKSDTLLEYFLHKEDIEAVEETIEPRSGEGMGRYVKSTSDKPEIEFCNNMFPYKENNYEAFEIDLEDVFFDYQLYVKKEFYFSLKKRTRMDVVLDDACCRSIIHQIVAVILNRMGFRYFQTGVIKILGDVLYRFIYKLFKSGDKNLIKEILNVKINDFFIVELQSYDEYSDVSSDDRIESETVNYCTGVFEENETSSDKIDDE